MDDKKSLFLIISILLLFGCASDIEEYPPKWVIASTYLPKMEGYRNAGFFEIGNSIYSHYCDSHGNMITLMRILLRSDLHPGYVKDDSLSVFSEILFCLSAEQRSGSLVVFTAV